MSCATHTIAYIRVTPHTTAYMSGATHNRIHNSGATQPHTYEWRHTTAYLRVAPHIHTVDCNCFMPYLIMLSTATITCTGNR